MISPFWNSIFIILTISTKWNVIQSILNFISKTLFNGFSLSKTEFFNKCILFESVFVVMLLKNLTIITSTKGGYTVLTHALEASSLYIHNIQTMIKIKWLKKIPKTLYKYTYKSDLNWLVSTFLVKLRKTNTNNIESKNGMLEMAYEKWSNNVISFSPKLFVACTQFTKICVKNKEYIRWRKNSKDVK